MDNQKIKTTIKSIIKSHNYTLRRERDCHCPHKKIRTKNFSYKNADTGYYRALYNLLDTLPSETILAIITYNGLHIDISQRLMERLKSRCVDVIKDTRVLSTLTVLVESCALKGYIQERIKYLSQPNLGVFDN